MTNHKELTHITHDSIPLFIDDESTVLILGSLPSVKSREDGFYYAHPRNRFFLVLSKIFGEDKPKTIDERKAFLTRHHIALYDVTKECDIYGSSDASIKNAKRSIRNASAKNKRTLIQAEAIIPISPFPPTTAPPPGTRFPISLAGSTRESFRTRQSPSRKYRGRS